MPAVWAHSVQWTQKSERSESQSGTLLLRTQAKLFAKIAARPPCNVFHPWVHLERAQVGIRELLIAATGIAAATATDVQKSGNLEIGNPPKGILKTKVHSVD